jgi:hypothetical protein
MKLRLILLFLGLSFITKAAVWKVGPTQVYKFCSEVVTKVTHGDTVLIDAAAYDNDAQVRWTANNLLIKGTGGRPILRAGSKISTDATNGKGIFVVGGKNTTIENIEFRDAKVLSHNGAGIRQEGANLIVRNCVFNGNEMGILQGGTIPLCTILVEHCVFLNGGSTADPGYQHNIYINHIDTFIFRYNFSYDAIAEGHELKSRANHNYILYNRISNITTNSSRNIDMPNGGKALIMGNLLEQNQGSANSNIIGFGLEGLTNPGPHNLFLVNNTIVNHKTTGSFFQLNAIDTLFLYNNIFNGAKTGGFIAGSNVYVDSSNNLIEESIAALKYVNKSAGDYRLLYNSPAVNTGILLNRSFAGMKTVATKEYVDTAGWKERTTENATDIGAYEFHKSLGVHEMDLLALPCYPNPFSDVLTFPSGAAHFEIYNASGSRIMDGLISETPVTINTSEWPSGLYVVVYSRGGETSVGKLLKE